MSEDARPCLNPNLAVRIFAVGLLQFLDVSKDGTNVCVKFQLDKTSSTAFPETDYGTVTHLLTERRPVHLDFCDRTGTGRHARLRPLRKRLYSIESSEGLFLGSQKKVGVPLYLETVYTMVWHCATRIRYESLPTYFSVTPYITIISTSRTFEILRYDLNFAGLEEEKSPFTLKQKKRKRRREGGRRRGGGADEEEKEERPTKGKSRRGRRRGRGGEADEGEEEERPTKGKRRRCRRMKPTEKNIEGPNPGPSALRARPTTTSLLSLRGFLFGYGGPDTTVALRKCGEHKGERGRRATTARPSGKTPGDEMPTKGLAIKAGVAIAPNNKYGQATLGPRGEESRDVFQTSLGFFVLEDKKEEERPTRTRVLPWQYGPAPPLPETFPGEKELLKGAPKKGQGSFVADPLALTLSRLAPVISGIH
ncbi:hypothetical protein WH47_08269 [Habropoda laboriosa]|uniref:Uncharacterized protein n=1 Tax=Habropoda laboriosa TaxID=597456 RepID=A0A0L7RGQ5_9HYME|nr:hypothetical protein WH47_08269 [Habropoda laboriosa]